MSKELDEEIIHILENYALLGAFDKTPIVNRFKLLVSQYQELAVKEYVKEICKQAERKLMQLVTDHFRG